MAKRQRNIIIQNTPPATTKSAWYQSGLFQFLTGSSLTFGVAGVSCAVDSHRLAAHLFFLAAWATGTAACWVAFSGVSNLRDLIRWSCIAIFTALLCVVDSSVVTKARAQVRITRIGVVQLKRGAPIQIAVEFQNIGDAPVKALGIYRAIDVSSLYEPDSVMQIENENRVYDEGLTVYKNRTLPLIAIPEHSVEEILPQIGTTIIDEPVLSIISSGDRAIYIAGTILYQDRYGIHQTDFCAFWNRRVTIGQAMAVCHTHNSEQ